MIVQELPGLHIEAKYTEKKCFLDWLDQAERDSAGTDQIPIVIHFRNREKEPILIMRARPFIEIVRRSDLVEPPKDELYVQAANEVSKCLLSMGTSASGLGNTGI